MSETKMVNPLAILDELQDFRPTEHSWKCVVNRVSGAPCDCANVMDQRKFDDLIASLRESITGMMKRYNEVLDLYQEVLVVVSQTPT